MNSKRSKISKASLGTILTTLFGIFLVGCGSSNDSTPAANPAPVANTTTATATLATDQEVPAPTAPSGGGGTGTVTIDNDTGGISGSITVDGLTGAVTAAHIHQAAVGTAGPIIIVLAQDASNPNKWNVPAGSMLSAAQLQAFKDGNLYFNAHTNANSGGEVRGQIGREVYTASLTGRQDGTSVTGTGSGRVVLDPSTNKADATFSVAGLTGNVTMAHIHTGGVGTDGPITITMAETSPNTFTASATLNSTQLSDLRGGNLYFNAHTVANAGGEIRGQIGRTVRFAAMDGSQEVPPTGAAATGSGFAALDRVNRTLSGSMTGTGLTGAATLAHIHAESVGKSGPIIVPFTITADGAAGGTFVASGTGSISASQVEAFLSDNTYMNLHTGTFPGGEIRGQLNLE